MSDLKATLMATLGVVETIPVVKSSPGASVPERPTPMYQYTVDVFRSEYGTVTVEAASKADAQDSWSDHDIHWYDCGDTEFSSIELDDVTPCNQDELDEWDADYGDKYTHDGEPKCSLCGDVHDSEALTSNDDETAWYCETCL